MVLPWAVQSTTCTSVLVTLIHSLPLVGIRKCLLLGVASVFLESYLPFCISLYPDPFDLVSLWWN